MPFYKAGADILPQIEHGGDYTVNPLLSGFTAGGAAYFGGAANTTSGYLYSGETYTPWGYTRQGGQIALQKAGCRPRTATRLWPSGGAGTAYIHRYANGAVYVTGSTSHTENTNDSRISWPYDSANYPRGVRYIIVQLCGGGGGGGAKGLASGYSNAGGQGAAGAVCVRLPENGYATIVVGGGGAAGSGIGDGGSGGGASSITCNGWTATAGAGGGGKGGQNSAGGGGSWSASANNADGVVIASSAGGSGTTAAKTVSYTDYAPEGGTITTRGGGAGGAAGSGGAYGAGGVGAVGIVDIWY